MALEVRPDLRTLLVSTAIGLVVGLALGGCLLWNLVRFVPYESVSCFRVPPGWALVRCQLLDMAPDALALLFLAAVLGLTIGAAQLVGGSIWVKSINRWLLYSAGGGVLGCFFGWLEWKVLFALFQFLEDLLQRELGHPIVFILFGIGIGGMYGAGIVLMQTAFFDKGDERLDKWVQNSLYATAIVGGVGTIVAWWLLSIMFRNFGDSIPS